MPSEEIALPQPLSPCCKKYLYLTPEDLQERYFSSIKEGTLVWVLKSKGCRPGSRSDLFLRARVVRSATKDDRILVQYPMGSTYHVRATNLIPILESNKYNRIVLVTGETWEYRRMAVVHTGAGESFLEIGCDLGTCTDRVRRQMLSLSEKPSVLGVDKSKERIALAQQRYLESSFCTIPDVLTDESPEVLRHLCQKHLGCEFPSVVAIDINGSRELPAVLECIRQLMHNVLDPHDLLQLRLIIVKSRTLLHYLKEQKIGEPSSEKSTAT